MRNNSVDFLCSVESYPPYKYLEAVVDSIFEFVFSVHGRKLFNQLSRSASYSSCHNLSLFSLHTHSLQVHNRKQQLSKNAIKDRC